MCRRPAAAGDECRASHRRSTVTTAALPPSPHGSMPSGKAPPMAPKVCASEPWTSAARSSAVSVAAAGPTLQEAGRSGEWRRVAAAGGASGRTALLAAAHRHAAVLAERSALREGPTHAESLSLRGSQLMSPSRPAGGWGRAGRVKKQWEKRVERQLPYQPKMHAYLRHAASAGSLLRTLLGPLQPLLGTTARCRPCVFHAACSSCCAALQAAQRSSCCTCAGTTHTCTHAGRSPPCACRPLCARLQPVKSFTRRMRPVGR
jgi:hypothetical protein